MATTRNFRLTGIIQTAGSIKAELNGVTVWDGPVGTTILDGLALLATGSFSYDPEPSPLLLEPPHTVVPCVITVNSGVLDIGLWEWDPTHVLNPALPPDCVNYYNAWDALPDDAPFAPSKEVNDQAAAAGGWWILPVNPAWWSGGKKHGPFNRFNMILNGTPITTFDDPSYIGPWNVSGLQAGDVLAYDLAIPDF